MNRFRKLVEAAVLEVLEPGDDRDRLNTMIRAGLDNVQGKFWMSNGPLGGLYANWAGVSPDTAGLSLENSPTRLMVAIHGLSAQEKQMSKPLEVEIIRKNGLRTVPGLIAKRGGTLEQIATHIVKLVTKAASTFAE